VKIAGYLKSSLIEWPGKIASVIFVPGCNFRCPFCHNADLVKNRGLMLLEEKQIYVDLEKRRKFIDGVVITGGEPTLQPDLSNFLKSLKERGFETMVETNGSRPEALKSILNFKFKILDFVAMDIKGNFDNYQNFTNVNPQISNVKSSVELILKSGIDFEFRTTVVPGLHNKRILIKMAEELKSLIENCKLKIENYHWYLQNFQPKNCLDPEFKKVKPFENRELQEFIKEVRKIIPQTELRGG